MSIWHFSLTYGKRGHCRAVTSEWQTASSPSASFTGWLHLRGTYNTHKRTTGASCVLWHVCERLARETSPQPGKHGMYQVQSSVSSIAPVGGTTVVEVCGVAPVTATMLVFPVGTHRHDT